MGFFLSGVGASSRVNVEEMQEALIQVQNTLQEVTILKQQTEQNNRLVSTFDERLTDYDTTTVKFRDV